MAFDRSFAQDDSIPLTNKAKIRDVYFSAGLVIQGNKQVSLQDFNTLAPNSLFLKNYFGSFDHSGIYNVNSGFDINGSVGINVANKHMTYYPPSPQLRIGLSYSSCSYLSYDLDKTERVPFDTVPSNVPGAPFVIDSVYRYNYSLRYYNEQLRVNASLLFRTSREKRWSFYGGAGLSLGMSMASYTDIEYNYSTHIQVEDNNVASGSYSVPRDRKDTFMLETFENPKSFGYSIYAPVGIDLRLGKRDRFMGKIHFYMEYWTGINAVLVPRFRFIHELALYSIAGLRVSLD